LEEAVFAAVNAPGCGVVEVLVPVEFDDEPGFGKEEVHVHQAGVVKGYG